MAHACARIARDQGTPSEFTIEIVGPKVYGVDAQTAFFYANYYFRNPPDTIVPQIYPLLFRTDDGGGTWLQLLDPVVSRVSNLREIRFLDKDCGWLEWYHVIEGEAFGILLTRDGGMRWHECEFHGIEYPSSLRAWAFTSRMDGACIVDDQAAALFEDKEVEFWKMRTRDGGHNWFVEATVVLEEPGAEARARLPLTTWATPSTRWTVLELDSGFAVQRMSEDGEWEPVLTLPRIPYRREPESK